jgi:hypothetical protein
VLGAAWHWGRERSVADDPLGELGHTLLYVGLLSVWGSVDGDLIFFLYGCRRAPFGDLADIHE